jgi:hypothetical protein
MRRPPMSLRSQTRETDRCTCLHLFRGTDLSPAGIVNLGDDADNVRLDQRTGNFVVGYGNGGLAVIDPVKGSLVGRIPLPAHPEGFQLDSSNGRAVVNVPDARQIAVVDLQAYRQATSWRLPDFRANFPMAIDPDRRMIAVVFRGPALLVILDAQDGTQRGSLATCDDADDVFFDSKRYRIYVSCGDGRVDVFQQDAAQYHRIAEVQSASGARTSLFVPDLDRLFVAARAGFFGLGSAAAILVYRPTD